MTPDANAEKLDAPREFWILDSEYENHRRAFAAKPFGQESIHVIEKSAYDALSAQLAESAAQVEELKRNPPVYDALRVSSLERKNFEADKENAQMQVRSAEKLARENSIRAYEAEKERDALKEKLAAAEIGNKALGESYDDAKKQNAELLQWCERLADECEFYLGAESSGLVADTDGEVKQLLAEFEAWRKERG